MKALLLAHYRHLRCYGSLVLFPALRPMQPDALVNDIQFDDAIFLWIPDHSNGIEPLLNDFDLLFKKLAQQYNAFIAHSEALFSSICNRPLSLPGHRVL